MAARVQLNPECAQGKCPNCTGYGWNHETDSADDCPHWCHRPEPDTDLYEPETRDDHRIHQD